MTDIKTTIKSKVNSIDPTVFDLFKTLTSDVDDERFNGSLALLQRLNKTQDAEQVPSTQINIT